MKHIKLFEKYKNNEEYYTIIDAPEFQKKHQTTIFTNDEVNLIKSNIYYKSKFEFEWGKYDQSGQLSSPFTKKILPAGRNLTVNTLLISILDKSILITKYEDEWYLVRINGFTEENKYHYIWYNCDQIDGLIKLLEYLQKLIDFTSISRHMGRN